MHPIFIVGSILVISALSSKVLYKYGIPTLIGFLALGVMSGPEALGLLRFEGFELVSRLCDTALMFIMFSGGFGTSWRAARGSAVLSGALATLGVAVTAALTGIGAHLLLGMSLYEGLLLGSIISSTDAASIFSILRSRRLNLKCNVASTLEVESGSNDPMAYMLTIAVMGLMSGGDGSIALSLLAQLFIGSVAGYILGRLAVFAVNRVKLEIDGLYFIITMGLVMLTFSVTNMLGGNGLLAVYIAGVIMGNAKMTHKVSLVRFYDGITWLMQIVLFFGLGLLASPSGIRAVWAEGMAIGLLVIFVARPVAVFLIGWAFRRPLNELLLLSWVGLRGAAAVVFAIYPLAQKLPSAERIFDIVFFVILLSVLLQGTLVAPIAKRLSLTSKDETVLKTFSDYSGEFHAELLEAEVSSGSDMDGKPVMDIRMPDDVLIITIKRGDMFITPKGSTVLLAGDRLLISADSRRRLVELDSLTKSHGRMHRL